MTGWEMSERPPLAPLWPKWSEKALNLILFRYLWNEINAIGMELTCLQSVYVLSNISSERLHIGKDCLSFGEIGSAFSFSISLFIVMSRGNGVPRCGCVRFDSLDWAGPAVAMMGCGGRKKSQHFANSLGEIPSFILIKASFSVIIHEGILRT